MIEHMKSFVNEHHTILVVIIGVLVVCFLYWYFCCKDRSLANKVKGGGGPVIYNTTEDRVNFYYSIGMDIIHMNNKPLIVISDDGENELSHISEIFGDFYFYEENFVISEQNLNELIASPLGLFIPDANSGNSFVKLFGKGFNVYTFGRPGVFDFHSVLLESRNIRPEIKGEILESYSCLFDILMKEAGSYFHAVSFVGQRCHHHNNNINCMRKNVHKSINKQGIFTKCKKAEIIYDDVYERIRNWYKTGGIETSVITQCYWNDSFGNIINFDEFINNPTTQQLKNSTQNVNPSVINDILNNIDNLIGKAHLDYISYAFLLYSIDFIKSKIHRNVVWDVTLKSLCNIFDCLNVGCYYQQYMQLLDQCKQLLNSQNNTLFNMDVALDSISQYPQLQNQYQQLQKQNQQLQNQYQQLQKQNRQLQNQYQELKNRYQSINTIIEKIKNTLTQISCLKYDTTNVSVKKENDPNEIDNWQVADIYPAYKLAVTVLLLIGISPSIMDKYNLSKTNYMKMIASYVLYVNLFNTFCGVKMNSSWNDAIKNEYVYEILNVPYKAETKMEIDWNLFGRMEGQVMGDHLDDIEEKYQGCGQAAKQEIDDREIATILGKLKNEYSGETLLSDYKNITVGTDLSNTNELCIKAKKYYDGFVKEGNSRMSNYCNLVVKYCANMAKKQLNFGTSLIDGKLSSLSFLNPQQQPAQPQTQKPSLISVSTVPSAWQKPKQNEEKDDKSSLGVDDGSNSRVNQGFSYYEERSKAEQIKLLKAKLIKREEEKKEECEHDKINVYNEMKKEIQKRINIKIIEYDAFHGDEYEDEYEDCVDNFVKELMQFIDESNIAKWKEWSSRKREDDCEAIFEEMWKELWEMHYETWCRWYKCISKQSDIIIMGIYKQNGTLYVKYNQNNRESSLEKNKFIKQYGPEKLLAYFTSKINDNE